MDGRDGLRNPGGRMAGTARHVLTIVTPQATRLRARRRHGCKVGCAVREQPTPEDSNARLSNPPNRWSLFDFTSPIPRFLQPLVHQFRGAAVQLVRATFDVGEL